MTRKKTRNTYKKRKNTSANRTLPVIWLVVGFAFGLIIPSYFLLKSPAHDSSQNEMLFKDPSSHSSKKRLTHSRKASASQKANYDFYHLLAPDEKVATVENEESDHDETSVEQVKLEVGKFKNFKEADTLKAQLAIMGFEVYISKNAKERLGFKVMAGPFNTPTEAAEVQKKLKSNAIDSVLVAD